MRGGKRSRERGNDYNRDMTETTPDSATGAQTTKGPAPAVEPTATASAQTSASPPPAPPPAAPKAGAAPRRGTPGLGVAVIVLVLLAAALAAGWWYQHRQAERSVRELASRLDGVSAEVGQLRRDARQALSLVQTQGSRVAALESALQDAQTQFDSLEQSLQNFSDNTGEALLVNDVDRMLALASQQLRLAGNVSNAVVALETAQARLARADQPRLAPLQQAINGDLDRLRAVPLVDVAAVSGRLDRLIDLVGRAPLLVPDAAAASVDEPAGQPSARPAPPPAAPPVDPDAPWWERLRAEMSAWPGRAWDTLGREVGDLISIQRVDDSDALLLSPDQGAQLRGNLRMRLLTAQLALLMRQGPVWESELSTVESALGSRFDSRAPETQAALRLARELAATDVAVPLPDIADSLSALAAVRAASQQSRGD
ncbi:uroporphyrinogen-III C-methyltransferase [Orrella sp. JC864]|uniref:uroporphyrinogen-III C-methyltransferase n=1 Tax=Orrella sp. JC864 TaxID=3120298 RepID=UPI00300841D5